MKYFLILISLLYSSVVFSDLFDPLNCAPIVQPDLFSSQGWNKGNYITIGQFSNSNTINYPAPQCTNISDLRCEFNFRYEYYTASGSQRFYHFACPPSANWGSYDTDRDGIINFLDSSPLNDTVAEIDTDADGIADSADNCPLDPNANQSDTDSDGIGDVCDTCGLNNNLDVTENGVVWLPTLPNSVCDGQCTLLKQTNSCVSGTCTANYHSVGNACSVNDLLTIDFADYVDTNPVTPPNPNNPNYDYNLDQQNNPTVNFLNLGGTVSGSGRTDQCFRIINCTKQSNSYVANFFDPNVNTSDIFNNTSGSCSVFDPQKNYNVVELNQYVIDNVVSIDGVSSKFLNSSISEGYTTNLIYNIQTNAGNDANIGSYTINSESIGYTNKLLDIQSGVVTIFNPSQYTNANQGVQITTMGCGFLDGNNNPSNPIGGGGTGGTGGTIDGINDDYQTEITDINNQLNSTLTDFSTGLGTEIASYSDLSNSLVGTEPSTIQAVLSALSPSSNQCPTDIVSYKNQNNLLTEFCDKWDNHGGRTTLGFIFYVLTSISIFRIWTTSSKT